MPRAPSQKVAAPTSPLGPWNAWLASLESRLVYTPWPFPVSGTEKGLTVNVRVGLDAPAKRAPRPAKGPGSPRVIRCSWGDVPPVGSVLKTSTGRRYLVALVRKRTLHTILLAPDEGLHRPHVDWAWDKKGTKKSRPKAA